jgi:hypothetical protein
LFFLPALTAAGREPASAPPQPDASSEAVIFGRVTDFEGRPYAGADVELKTVKFENAAAVRSGPDGSYSLTVKEGMYIALAAVKEYRTKHLEYWAWNVPAYGRVRIDPRFDRIEVYALNAFRPQGGYPSYIVYFRPMSLTKTMAAVVKAGGMEGLAKLPLIDIAPELEPRDIQVTIDGERVDILELNKVKEAGRPGQDLFGCLIQVPLPKSPAAGDWVVLDLTLTDRTTGEKGEGRLYIRRPLWR